ncbi:hypothetical protein CEP54_006414 [Fusarium duplospermum]|uniref:Uncharacterized protein n=1 Tax=Fusarium duplospermum TaxID=1325734 RepID=A0A428Q6W2_9HYPO|nr:hypothetical protein CEP54_006414 [Fusarium duplospermum]
MDPIEYGHYEEILARGGPEYDGINLHHLCTGTTDAIWRVNGAFRDILFEALIIGPSIAVEEIHPRTLPRFHGHLKDMEKLRRLLPNATQQLDQVIYIARHVTENITESIVTDETNSWKTALVRDFKAYREMQLLRETKDKIGDLLDLRHNLAVIESALEILFAEQRNIIYK